MRVITTLSEIPENINSIVSIGSFDGVHLGHQQILKSLIDQKTPNAETLVITFWPHPKKVLTNSAPLLLSTLDERLEEIEKIGIDNVLVLEFTTAISNLSAEEFLENILIKKLHLQKIILGYDHKFGNDRKGDIAFLKEASRKHQFEVIEIPAQLIDNSTVSSTAIRKAIHEHDMSTAQQLLGRYYSIQGTVNEGQQLGRTIGYPTANLTFQENQKLLPPNGVYAVYVNIENEQFSGMMNIGHRPTVNGNTISYEVHIFDFNKNIYSKPLTVQFVQYIRDEVKFENIQALITQLQLDEKNIRALLK
jgi:riboflavin kinase/FMN adenylyltransferase